MGHSDDKDAKIADLEKRLALIESFLDQEMQVRQHFAMLQSPFSHGPINPWHGCGGTTCSVAPGARFASLIEAANRYGT